MNKRVLYLHQYFITPNQPGGTRSYWISRELINRGYKVTMITSRNIQKNKIERVSIDGIDVIYIRNKYDNNFGILRRVISFIQFMLVSTVVAFKEKDVSLIFATSTPLTIGIPALFLKWFKRKRYIFEVRDLWPEVPIQMGGVTNKFLIWVLVKFEKIIYVNATHIIALSPGMKLGVVKTGIEETKVSMIPNMSKIHQFFLREKNRIMMADLDLYDDKFYIIHFGAMGLANGIDYIIDTAKLLMQEDNSDIEFLFVGGGSQEAIIKEKSKEYGLNNISFLGKFKMDEMSELVNIADCSIVSFANFPILQTNSPNKLFDSLSAQKPIIVNSAGWTKQLVEDNKCGAYVNAENPKELMNLLLFWRENPKMIEDMGMNSRNLAKTVYDKSILSKQVVDVVKKSL